MRYLPIFPKNSLRTQQGLSLIELIVAMALSLFLILGLLTIFKGMKMTEQAQTGIARVQERQRSSTSILANVVQSSGYFPVDASQSASLGNLAAFKKAYSKCRVGMQKVQVFSEQTTHCISASRPQLMIVQMGC